MKLDGVCWHFRSRGKLCAIENGCVLISQAVAAKPVKSTANGTRKELM